ncbi:MAG: hypothetical protein K9M10_02050 [Candidatus Pacebacteria bacterium]|nr:hypothetical protein [Candidatus Paceibacterota bacterium]MCF7857246.1 hypothetical protein [Candidatus Paceibacterota bacterium]
MNPKLLPITAITKKDILILEDASAPLVISLPVHDIIDATWVRLTSENKNLYEAPLVRFIDFVEDDYEIRLRTATDITYKHVVGLRNTVDFLDKIPKEQLFQALTAIAIVKTSDNFTILVERDTGDWPHSLELPGTFIRTHIYEKGLYESTLDFLHGDLGIAKMDIKNHSLIGILDYISICEMMLVYQINLSISFNELTKLSPKNIFSLPKGYTTEKHLSFFELPLHVPTQTVLNTNFNHQF